MAGPAITYGSAGNVVASGSVSGGASTTATSVDFSTSGAFGGDIAVKVTTGGTVAGTNGCRLDIYAQGDASSTFDTVATYTYTFSGLSASTTYQKSLRVPTGIYNVKATNLDATNAITVQITSSKLS